MKIVILTSGPQGAGKTSYVQAVREQHPGVKIVSRDNILMDLYGTTSFCPYEGFPNVFPIMYTIIKRYLKQGHPLIIFDCWNGYPEERSRIIARLRTFGVTQIICWKFVTPLYVCRKWYKNRKSSHFYSEHNYHVYHKLSKDMQQDGFDDVQYINPLQLSLEFPRIQVPA